VAASTIAELEIALAIDLQLYQICQQVRERQLAMIALENCLRLIFRPAE
jgi:hypothetical protein